MVAVSHPCKKLPIAAATATSTAPPIITEKVSTKSSTLKVKQRKTQIKDQKTIQASYQRFHTEPSKEKKSKLKKGVKLPMVAKADIEMANKASSLQIPINIWQQRKKKELIIGVFETKPPAPFTLLSLSSTYPNEKYLSLGLHRSFVKKHKQTNQKREHYNCIISSPVFSSSFVLIG
ncbi:hypothetical protein V6Z12_D01G014000 [Gossypium hirsutum]